VKLTVIGCSGSFPSADAMCSCYLVEADGFRLLLDLGNGALGVLQRHLSPYEVDAVLLSHLHADHCIDLCGYYVARRYRPDGPVGPLLPVYGPAGAAERLAHAYGLPPDPGLGESFEFRTLRPGSFSLGPFTVRVDHVNHPVETFATRLEYDGRSLTYSGDTGESDALVRLAGGSDLLLCEASFLEGRDTVPDLHLTGRQAGEHAARARVGRLVLTHIPPWTEVERTVDDAHSRYDGPIDVARPDVSYKL
jgi:ribonuclease BN (tRNA processing enzyme)